LALVGVQQDRAALSASVIDRLVACLKYRRGLQNVALARRDDYFKTDLSSAHGCYALHRREHNHSQPPTPGAEPQSVMRESAPILRESRASKDVGQNRLSPEPDTTSKILACPFSPRRQRRWRLVHNVGPSVAVRLFSQPSIAARQVFEFGLSSGVGLGFGLGFELNGASAVLIRLGHYRSLLCLRMRQRSISPIRKAWHVTKWVSHRWPCLAAGAKRLRDPLPRLGHVFEHDALFGVSCLAREPDTIALHLMIISGENLMES
jgi:hypothetical protein